MTMARPTNKADLLTAASAQYDKMIALIDKLSPEEQETPFRFSLIPSDKAAHWNRDRNLRDVLMHLYEWHQLTLNFVAANMTGDGAPFLPAPYNWKSYGDMNVGFFKKHQTTPYADARNLLAKSHADTMALIDTFTNEELFEKVYFDWTGMSNVGSYFVSNTSSHYDWAMKKIKRHIKSLHA